VGDAVATIAPGAGVSVIVAASDFVKSANDLAVGAPGEVLEACPECENQGAVSVLLETSTGLTATGLAATGLAAEGGSGHRYGADAVDPADEGDGGRTSAADAQAAVQAR